MPKDMSGGFNEEFTVFWKQYSAEEVKASFFQPWIPAGVKDAIRNFYRPFAIVTYANLFEVFGNDLLQLHKFLLYFSFIKFAAFFGVIYFLSGRSLWFAFCATFLYSVSFKIFEEQLVLQDLPDLLLATFFFTATFLFIVFSTLSYRPAATTFLGTVICLLFVLCVGTKENGFFLFPTLLAYRLTFVWEKGVSIPEFLKRAFDRKHLIFFFSMSLLSISYFVIRYHALGAAHVMSPSWGIERRPGIVYSLINVANSFSMVPLTYIDHLFANDWLSAGIRFVINLMLPLGGIYLCLRSDVSTQIKKAIVFSLLLILINTFFYTLGIRVRFNSISTLGSIFIAVALFQWLFRYISGVMRGRKALILKSSILLPCLYVYIVLNVWNVLHRTHQFHLAAPFEAGIFEWRKILNQDGDNQSTIGQMNRLNADAATFGQEEDFSFFLLAVVLDSGHRTLDCFDMAYRGLLKGQSAEIQLKRVQMKSASIHQREGYRQEFGLGLVEAAELLLKPKQAFEERGMKWSDGFDMNDFRKRFDKVATHFERSGPIGEGILKQFKQVRTKIDADQDGQFSDEEIQTFLTSKLTSPEAN